MNNFGEAQTPANVIDTSCDCDGGEDMTVATKSPPRRRRGYIPYSTIYESQDEVRKNGYWIPGIPVEATIVKVQRDTSSGYHILNPFMFVKFKKKILFSSFSATPLSLNMVAINGRS